MKRTGWGLALLMTVMLGAAPARAATTYTVTGTVDAPGATCTGTVCASLRAAVTNVPSGGTIQLSSGIYKLNGVLQIGQSETIVGLSPSQTTIQQTKPGDGVIEASTGDLSLSQLTITGGRKVGHATFDQHAGGIYQAGSSLTMDHVSVTGNTATGSSLSGADGGDAVGGIQIAGSDNGPDDLEQQHHEQHGDGRDRCGRGRQWQRQGGRDGLRGDRRLRRGTNNHELGHLCKRVDRRSRR